MYSLIDRMRSLTGTYYGTAQAPLNPLLAGLDSHCCALVAKRVLKSAKETYAFTKECCKYAKEPWISLGKIGAYSKEKGAEANLV
mmetsp:Transcript_116/g.207  ORF Transcript_116/g.207 Transcript_116/m.207 type:complete len:85 (+) Transcript_116:181-435(+)